MDRPCGIDQRASQLHWRYAGDQKNANRLSQTRSCPKAASGLTASDDRVGYLGPYPSADEDGCDDQQSERQVGPDEHGDRGVEREPMRPAQTRPNTVDSRMLKSQRSTEIATSAMSMGLRDDSACGLEIGQDLTSVSSIKLPIN
jgi:hypothetical protein